MAKVKIEVFNPESLIGKRVYKYQDCEGTIIKTTKHKVWTSETDFYWEDFYNVKLDDGRMKYTLQKIHDFIILN